LKRAVLFWSGGKDSAWALRECAANVIALVTTFEGRIGKVPMHDVPIDWIRLQALQLELPVWTIPLEFPCSNVEYRSALTSVYERALAGAAETVIFGDLFLEDIREFREASLQGTGLEPMFPLWGRDTQVLAREMIAAGLQAEITGIDEKKLPRSFLGRRFDEALLTALPEGIDPCGENGEFHTFVYEPHRLLNR
jgi:uncharacterized protein (TIGR00290 family)